MERDDDKKKSIRSGARLKVWAFLGPSFKKEFPILVYRFVFFKLMQKNLIFLSKKGVKISEK